MLETLKARKEALEARGESGFTLMEMLIVIAIIAILIAIAIPVFTAQLERAGEATDAANVRAAYAEIMTQYITDPNNVKDRTVSLQQSQANWQNDDIKAGLEKLKTDSTSGLQVDITGNPAAKGKATLSVATGNEPKLTIAF